MVEVATFLQFIMNGVVFGAILALGAIGLTLVYGILNLANFAHGDFLTFGAFMALLFASPRYVGYDAMVPAGLVVGLVLVALPLVDLATRRRFEPLERNVLLGFGALIALAAGFVALRGIGGVGSTDRVLVLATLLAMAATAVLTVALEFVVWRPLRRKRANVLTLVIVSIGLALVVRNGLQQYFGGGLRFFQRPVGVADSFGGVLVTDAQQLAILVTVVVVTALHLFLTYTRTGKAMRAVSDNFDLARVSGINVDRVVVYVWVIAALLVALAGVMLTLVANNNMNVNMGFTLIIPLFAATILGGIGSPYGAMLGGLVVGVGMKASALVPFMGTRYELATALIILILVLLVRPQGILGRKA